MTKFGKIILAISVIAILTVVVFFLNKKALAPSVPVNNSVLNTLQPEILGNKDDLVSFSISPGAKVSGLTSYNGVIKGAYFFEANIVINILDANKNVLKRSNTMATTDWMTPGPVYFEGNIDFTGLPKGPAYFEIHNDNASGLPEHDKSILIPIVIE